MGSEPLTGPPGEAQQPADAQFTGAVGAGEPAAWEEVAEGRYMPRRIKGSCKGRALG
jgi:hypothetical protein